MRLEKNVLLLISIITIAGIFPLSSVPFGEAQSGTNINGIINSDVTWTAANSPYTLTAPTAVNFGVTLTIAPSVTVNLNNYYIQVNGTLNAKGTANSIIQFMSGALLFTPASNGWNENAGSGCIIEYAHLSQVTISSINALKLNQDQFTNGSITVGIHSVLTNNNISSSVAAGGSVTFAGNKIGGSINAGGGCTISGNNVKGAVICSGSSATISNNIIGGQVTGETISGNTISSATAYDVTGTTVTNNHIINGTVKATTTITNNVIVSGTRQASFRVFGGYATSIEDTPAIISSGSPTITGNTITGGGIYTSFSLGQVITGPESGYTSPVTAIDLTNAQGATISRNVIVGRGGVAIKGQSNVISSNTITGDIYSSAANVQNNAISGSLILSASIPPGSNTLSPDEMTASNNVVSGEISVSSSSWSIQINKANAITVKRGNGAISDNSVTNGAGITINGATATIERNYIHGNGNPTTAASNVTYSGPFGISVINGKATISKNTISSNGVGIALFPSSDATINYNNIQNNGFNVILETGMPNNVDATYNWWGTTDNNAIGQSIHDFNSDFNLGTVTFLPLLSDPNTEAVPSSTPHTDALTTAQPTNPTPTTSVPEFAPITTLIILLIVSATVIGAFKVKKTSSQIKTPLEGITFKYWVVVV